MTDILDTVDESRPAGVPADASLYSVEGQTRFCNATAAGKFTGEVRRYWVWTGDDGQPYRYAESVPPTSEELAYLESVNYIACGKSNGDARCQH